MTNKENQKRLDNKKYLESEAAGFDKAGSMEYCDCCDYQKLHKESKSGKICIHGYHPKNKELHPYPCATAYNRMKRGSK